MSRFTIVETEEALLEGEMHNGSVFLHVVYKATESFTHTCYKKLLRIWAKARTALREKGITEVFSFVTTKSDMVNKWQVMFGMEPLLETASHILYRRKLV